MRARRWRYPRGPVGVQGSRVTFLGEGKGGVGVALYARTRVGAARRSSLAEP